MEAVSSEVNTFLATFANPSDVLDLRYYTGESTGAAKHLMIHAVTVIYLE